MTGDPYLDPGSGVFRNRLGLTDRTELAAVEKRLSTARIAQLKRRRLPGRYDLDHLRAFHWTIFQDVYPWAGQLRTVLIVKAGGSFCLPHQIQDTAAGIFDRLATAGHLRGRDREGFLDGLVPLLAEVNALHPFREGNGRTQRAFLSQLAPKDQQGFTLTPTGQGESKTLYTSQWNLKKTRIGQVDQAVVAGLGAKCEVV